MICPKCGYERRPADTAPDYECPKCGIVYAKFNALRQPAPAAAPAKPEPAKAQPGNALKNMFAKIQSRENAISVAKETGTLFMVVAALQGILGLFLQRWLLLDAAIFALCGYFIFSRHSRVAAVIALVISAAAAVSTFMNITGHNVGGGSNIFLALIVAIGGFRAVDATFKLNGAFKETAKPGVPKLEPAPTAGVSANQDA